MPSRALNRLLWAAVLLAIVVLGFKTRDNLELYFAGVGTLDVREAPDGGTVYLNWRGKIAAPMASRIAEAYERYQGTAGTFVLSLSSPGGSLAHGADVVRLLRKIKETHRLDTVVEAGRRCASMCVPIYLQGQLRTAAESAQFMFHEVSFMEFSSKERLEVPESATASATDSLFERYFVPAGVPVSWIRSVRAAMAGGNDVWKTGRELVDEDSHIVQQVF
ncbi:MAG: hypothetical protein WBP38_04270 [Hyphomicrobium sp.]|nr:hypothetical protein [Hyphomicrobium sp.]